MYFNFWQTNIKLYKNSDRNQFHLSLFLGHCLLTFCRKVAEKSWKQSLEVGIVLLVPGNPIYSLSTEAGLVFFLRGTGLESGKSSTQQICAAGFSSFTKKVQAEEGQDICCANLKILIFRKIYLYKSLQHQPTISNFVVYT